MMKELPKDTCPMFGDKCDYLSNDAVSKHPYTRLKKNESTGLFDAAGTGCVRVVYRERCNNAVTSECLVDEMHYCPARWARTRNGLKYKTKE